MILKTLVRNPQLLKLKYCESQLYRKRKRAASSTANRRKKFSHDLQKMALEVLYKDSKYPSHGVIEEFAKLNNLDGAIAKYVCSHEMIWMSNG